MAAVRGFGLGEAREEVLGLVPLCAAVDPDAWFERNTPQVRQCVRICARCPLRTSCLAGALAREEQFGVWGGIRFRTTWLDGYVRSDRRGPALYGHDVAGDVVRRPQPGLSLVEAEQRLGRWLYRGRRRALVSRWVRRVGKPVGVPGGWWIGPWSVPDRRRREELLRRVVPSMLRDRPVDRWPWELRLLAEMPASAIPKAARQIEPRPLNKDRPLNCEPINQEHHRQESAVGSDRSDQDVDRGRRAA